ncbi:MAG: hypothetical protein VKK42_15335 [Lyngbya sp.]|nr:hypothetical protein [Lyngbya sp.]
MEFSLINVLAIVASVLILVVTGGILYLTAIEWRDRRRQDREKKQQR